LNASAPDFDDEPETPEEEQLDLDRLQDIIHIFEASELLELEIEEADCRIRLRKGSVQESETSEASPGADAPQIKQFMPMKTSPASGGVELEEGATVTINSPMVGVFYGAPGPGKPPFVKPGDTVAKDQKVCIIEAMKLMNEVMAKAAAEILEVLVENGEPVEYDQPLFLVRPLE